MEPMSKLIEYLETHFPNGNDETIPEHFFNEFGVNVRVEDDLLQFKYDMIAVKWSEQCVFECRGHILTFDNGWRFVSRPFDKFFNLSEGHCPLFGPDSSFNRQIPLMKLREKADGTCIQVYSHKGKVRVSTLGTITTMDVGYSGITFEKLFWNSVKNKEDFINGFNEYFTYLFELCTPYNQIVTTYGKDPVVFLLAVRNNVTGKVFNVFDDNSIHGFKAPAEVDPVEMGFEWRQDFINFVESESESDKYGKNPEGWIIYLDGAPVAKMKNSRYLALHRFSGGDPLCSRNSLIDLFLAGGIDDVYGDLLEPMQEYCDNMGAWLRESFQDVSDLCKEIHEKQPETQKDYAMMVVKNPYSAFFFGNKDIVMAGEATPEVFSTWVKVNKPKGVIEKLKKLWVHGLEPNE